MRLFSDPRRDLSALLMALSACADGALAPEAPRPVRAYAMSVAADDGADFELAQFQRPSQRFAPGVRWVWPGGAVEPHVIEEQIQRLARLGYGLIEIQPAAFRMTEVDYAADARIRSVGEPEFFERVRVAARALRREGLGFELTLGSGWPNGGVGVPEDAVERQALWTRVDVTGPRALDLALAPATEPSWVVPSNELLKDEKIQIAAEFDQAASLQAVVAAPLVDETARPVGLGTPRDVSAFVHDGRLQWQVPAGRHAILTFHQNRTSHIVLRNAYPGAEQSARVIDHLSSTGSDWLVRQQMVSWLDHLGADRPDRFFVESFELTGELPWSPQLAARYQAETGRAPFVDAPFFVIEGSETKYVDLPRGGAERVFTTPAQDTAERLREDYERVRAEVFHDAFVAPIAQALATRGIGLRMQAFGGWGAALDDFMTVETPETEGLYAGGSFDSLTLAASAAHVAARPVVSLEAFTRANLAPAVDENALWAVLGLAFSAGINRPVHSTIAYPYVLGDGTRWQPMPETISPDIRPESAEWSFLPRFIAAQTRVGYALRTGQPQADIAWLMTAREQRDQLVVGVGPLGAYGAESALSAALRADSFTYDRVSAAALADASSARARLQIGAASYRALVISDARVIDEALLVQAEAAAESGVPVVWLGEPPTRAFGATDAASRDAAVTRAWSRLAARAIRVETPAEVGAALRRAGVQPDVETRGTLAQVGLRLRRDTLGLTVWLFNEAALPQTFSVLTRLPVARAVWLDPDSGEARELRPLTVVPEGAGGAFSLTLPALRGGVLRLEERRARTR